MSRVFAHIVHGPSTDGYGASQDAIELTGVTSLAELESRLRGGVQLLPGRLGLVSAVLVPVNSVDYYSESA